MVLVRHDPQLQLLVVQRAQCLAAIEAASLLRHDLLGPTMNLHTQAFARAGDLIARLLAFAAAVSVPTQLGNGAPLYGEAALLA